MERCLRALALAAVCSALAGRAQATAPVVTITDPNTTTTNVVPLSLNVDGTFTGSPIPTVTVDVDGGSPVTANVVAPVFSAAITMTAGPHTIHVTATNSDGSDTKSVDVVGDPAPVLTIDAPVNGFTTGDATVDVSGTIDDNDLDDPNATLPTNFLTANGTDIPVTRTGVGTGTFSGKAPIFLGTFPVRFVARDSAGNTVTNNTISVTRTKVCVTPTLPQTNNADPGAPHRIEVSRIDDLPMPKSFDPNDPNDFNDPNACDVRPTPPGVFNPPSAGRCTLRAALQLANAHPGPDVIVLPRTVVTLTRQGAGEDAGLLGDLDVTGDLAVVGFVRDSSVIDARKLGDRVFDVRPGVSFTLTDATVRGGKLPSKSSEPGGCIRFAGGPLQSDPESGKLAVFKANDVALLDCKAGGAGGGLALLQDPNVADASLEDPNDANSESVSSLTCAIVARSSAKQNGGGISAEHQSLALRNSTIAQTSSSASGGGIALLGGRAVLTNDTLSTNKAKKSGGGLALASGAKARVNNVTLAKNKAKAGMSLSTSDETGGANTLVVSNTILGDKPKKTCDTPPTSAVDSLGGNLDPGTSCDLPSGELSNTDPKLDKLATNAGIPTHALKSDSPAIDAGVFALCEPLDERDADRVNGPGGPANNTSPDQCDIGAFEFASTPAPPPTP